MITNGVKFLLSLVLIAFAIEKKTSTTVLETSVFVRAVDDYQQEKDLEAKKKNIENILNLIESNQSYEYKDYWRAVFLTFQCEIRDQGRLIPFCIMGSLSEIKKLLQSSYEKYPEYYHYAPARTLGIMYMKMPSIVGGSYKKSLKYLQFAYDGDSDFEDNQKWLDEVKSKTKD